MSESNPPMNVLKKASQKTSAAIKSHRLSKILTQKTINPSILNAHYAVRGPIVNRAYEISELLKSPQSSFPFKKLYMCNIGNPQELGQTPITFIRQTLAACLFPSEVYAETLPSDVLKRAAKIRNSAGSIGAYTHSQGLLSVRQNVAKYLFSRDGVKSKAEDIFLTDGATPAIKNMLQMIISSPNVGVMIPIPQYPLYSASINLFGGKAIGYYLNERKNWSVSLKDIESAHKKAVEKGITPKAICVINPGNPTGQVISQKNICEIIDFAIRHNMVVLADEVYQTNIYSDRPFVSFRKCLSLMGEAYKDLELISFDSVSKGMFGECGLRGGYAELLNVDEEVKALYLRMASLCLCPNIVGQIAVDISVRPPLPNEESYSLFTKEYNEIKESLKRRAKKVSKMLSNISGINCNEIKGAMYAFPTIKIPKNAVIDAEKKGMKPDEMYCLELLEQKGVCAVPGSGFQQEEGTYHLRLTILPPEHEVDQVLDSIKSFHMNFVQKYL